MEWQHCFCAGVCDASQALSALCLPVMLKETHLSVEKDGWSVEEKELAGGVSTPVGQCMSACMCVCVCVRKSLLSQWPVSSLVSQSCAVWTSFHGSDKHASLIWSIHIQIVLTPSFNMHLRVLLCHLHVHKHASRMHLPSQVWRISGHKSVFWYFKSSSCLSIKTGTPWSVSSILTEV